MGPLVRRAPRDLGEAATARLIEQLPEAFGRFDEAYDDPDAVDDPRLRGRPGRAATPTSSWLSDNVGRRMFALPMPATRRRSAGRQRTRLSRRALVEAEFGACTPPTGMTSEQFVDAAYRVIEELWRDANAATFQAARRMFADGVDRHDIIHRWPAHPRRPWAHRSSDESAPRGVLHIRRSAAPAATSRGTVTR